MMLTGSDLDQIGQVMTTHCQGRILGGPDANGSLNLGRVIFVSSKQIPRKMKQMLHLQEFLPDLLPSSLPP